MPAIPQHVSIVTLGTEDVAAIRTFYESWGWRATEGSEATWCAFDVGGVLLSFFSMRELAAEVGDACRPAGSWGGYTLALNLPSRRHLQEAIERAVGAGATLISEPRERAWGGYSGYLADPDGNRWELATGGPNPAG